MNDRSSPPQGRNLLAKAICATLVVVFALTSWLAVRTKSPTYDETMHAAAADLIWNHDDYRLNPEDPPLWQRWAMLGRPRPLAGVDLQDPAARQTLDRLEVRYPWIRHVLYQTPGNRADLFINRLRIMMVVLGACLVAVICVWSWRLAGPVAAVAAGTLAALDPNLLAHAGMVKNDVAVTLVGAALGYVTWRVGLRLTWPRAIAFVLLCAAAPVTKFSGPLLPVIATLLLFIRCALPLPWIIFGRTTRSALGRLGAATALSGLAAVITYGTLWASYSFRFAPTPARLTWNIPRLKQDIATFEVAQHFHTDLVEPSDVDRWRLSGRVRSLLYCEKHHLLPQTWVYGILHTYRSSIFRDRFLNGRMSGYGSPDYFPLAWTYKAPLATQAAVYLAILIGIIKLGGALRRRAARSPALHPKLPSIWLVLCIAVPMLVFAALLLSANLNIGIRHLLPVYPFAYVAAGGAVAFAWRGWPRITRVLSVACVVGLVLETAAAFPNYLPFFNVAAGGSRGGLALLADSNLDWGQDLPLLAEWQRRNPDRPLYLCYFGTADPAAYGIRYTPLPGSMTLESPASDLPNELPTQPGVIVMSASMLQGLFLTEPQRTLYYPMKKWKPTEVLGGSLYVFEYPLK